MGWCEGAVGTVARLMILIAKFAGIYLPAGLGVDEEDAFTLLHS